MTCQTTSISVCHKWTFAYVFFCFIFFKMHNSSQIDSGLNMFNNCIANTFLPSVKLNLITFTVTNKGSVLFIKWNTYIVHVHKIHYGWGLFDKILLTYHNIWHIILNATFNKSHATFDKIELHCNPVIQLILYINISF